MTRLFVVCVLCLINSVSYATGSHLSIDSRIDYESYNQETNSANPNANPSYESFRFNRLKFVAKGEAVPQVSYLLRLNPSVDFDSTSQDSNSKSSHFVEFAWISHQFSKEFNLMLGKLFNYTGGIENYWGSGEVYHFSDASAVATQAKYSLAEGLQAHYRVSDQHFMLGLSNSSQEENDDEKSSQHGFGVGAMYRGSFFDKTALPYITFHYYKITDDQKEILMALGHTQKYKNFELHLDYLHNVHEDQTFMGKDDTETGIVVHLKYMHPHWRPSVKYSQGEVKSFESSLSGTAMNYDYRNYRFALEFYPMENVEYRYHLVLMRNEKEYSTSNHAQIYDADETSLLVGTRFLFDFF